MLRFITTHRQQIVFEIIVCIIYIYQKVGQNDHKSIEIERETDKMGNSCLLLFFLFVYGFYMIFCTNIKKPQNEERLLLNICQEK